MKKLSDGDYFHEKDIPSYTQWESKNLVDMIITNQFDTKNDPLWSQSWAINQEEYEMYSWQICWITCLKMILKSINNIDYRLIELAKDAENYWVYTKNHNQNIKNNLDGLFHKKFLLYISKFSLAWKLVLSTKEYYIAYLLKNNYFVIASVHPCIREKNIINNSKKWHLILVVGFQIINSEISGFFINNPSGYFEKSQEKHFVNINNWRKTFSGNIDIIYLNSKK